MIREFSVWQEDDRLAVRCVKRELDTWVEFTIRRPIDGLLEVDPVVEGIITPSRFEWQTLGMYDGSERLLCEALREVKALGQWMLGEGRGGQG